MRKLRIGLVPFVLLIVLATTQCATNSARIVDVLPVGINLSDAKSVEVRNEADQVVLSGTFSNYKAPLTSAGTIAKGLAEIEIAKAGSGLKQEIEVSVENLRPSANFSLVVDGKNVATFLTSSAGKRDLKFTRTDP